jgi:ribosomal protein L28
MQWHRFFVPSLNRFVGLRVTAHGIRVINKRGARKKQARKPTQAPDLGPMRVH